jgi:hypothetical protein
MARRRPRRRLLALLALLLLLLLFKLNPFLAGVLPGGGRWHDEPEPAVRPGALEIVVVDPGDRVPVAGATIRLAGLDGREQQRRTDAGGVARFAGLAAEPIRVEAEGPGGFATAWSKPGTRVELALAPRPRRTGRVRDGDDRAVAAEVHLLDRDARILASARTGADGRYELPDDPRAVAVCAWPDQGAPASSADGDIVVGDGVRHTGEATDPGAATMEVFALVPDSTADRVVPLRVSWTVSDDGTYEGLLPRDAQAYAFYGSYAVPLGEAHDIAMMQLGQGRIVDERGEPIAGVRIAARALSRGMPVAPNPFAIERVTDAQGAFDLGWGPNTRYELELSAPGRARLLVALPREPDAITLPAGFRVGGRVLDVAGHPVAGAHVDALPTPDPDGRFLAARTRTTDDGRFYADGLGGEYARVRVGKRGFVDATMDRVPPDGFVTLVLRRE